MKKFEGTYTANIATIDGVLEGIELLLDFKNFHAKIILNVDSEMKPTSMYFENPSEYICVCCKRSHWYDDSMKCLHNDNLMNEIWGILKPKIEKQMKDNCLFNIIKH